MKLNDLQKIYESLHEERFEMHLDMEIMERARKPIQQMLEVSVSQ